MTVGKNVGAIMADATVAAASAAGINNIARTNSASGAQRVSPLRPVSAVAPTPQAFTQNLAFLPNLEVESPETAASITPDPGNARLSSSVQLILAETRTQEDLSDFVDRSTLDQAASSYLRSQASVQETIGLAQIAAANTNGATGSGDTNA